MKTIYISASKSGKEAEREFTTLERAEADVWVNNYYIGCVIEESVADDEFESLKSSEAFDDEESYHFQELTQLDKYRGFLKGCASSQQA